MRKRTWIYVQKPAEYSIHCDKCGGDNIEWSEYEHKIWCYDCQIDTDGDGGIFDGPIPLMCSQLLGINFARVYLKDGIVKYPRLVGHKIKWFAKYKPFGMESK
jgi:hypothetical protein